MQLAPYNNSFINELPNELLAKIFTFCVDTSVTLSPDTRRAIPLDPLAEVCSRWRAVIRWRPELWVDISVDFKDFTHTKCLVNAARRCLSRTGNHLPITLSLYTTVTKIDWLTVIAKGGHKHPILSIIYPFASRLRDVRLSLPYAWLVEFFSIPHGHLNILESAYIEQIIHCNSDRIMAQIPHSTFDIFSDTPALKHLTLRSFPRIQRLPVGISFASVLGPNTAIPWEQLSHLDLVGLQIPYGIIHKILQRSINLTSCALSTGPPTSEAVGTTDLPHLKTLTLDIHTCGWLYLSPCRFPVLERLILQGSLHNRFSSDFISAMIWGLPLKSIHTSIPMQETSVERLFRAAPALIEFEASGTCYISDSTLDYMARGDLVPRLERVRCSLQTVLLGKFIDMLESRWALEAAKPALHRAIYAATISCFVREADRWDFEDDEEMDEMVRRARERLREIGEKAEGIRILDDDYDLDSVMVISSP